MQCLFDLSIGELNEPESYEEKIDQLNDYDRAYGIMCLAMSLEIHHLIDHVEYPFECWNNLEKSFGMQGVEDEAWSEPNISSCALSQDVLASTFSDEFIYDEQVSHTVHVATTLFDSNGTSFNEEANTE